MQVDEPDESIEEQHKRAFGPYAERLREIAVEVGADYCVSCLDRWLKGAWPPVRNPPMLKILEVRGVTRRGNMDQDLSQRLRYRDYLGAGLSLSSTRGWVCKARPKDGVIHVAGTLSKAARRGLGQTRSPAP